MEQLMNQVGQQAQDFKPIVSPTGVAKGKKIKRVNLPVPRLISFVDPSTVGMEQQGHRIMDIPTGDMIPKHDLLVGLKRRVSLPGKQEHPSPFKKAKTAAAAVQPQYKIRQDIQHQLVKASTGTSYKGSAEWTQNIYYGYNCKEWTDASGNVYYESLIGHMHMEPAGGCETKHGIVSDIFQVLQQSGRELIPLKQVGKSLPPNKTRRKLMAELQRRRSGQQQSGVSKTVEDESPAAAKTEQKPAAVDNDNATEHLPHDRTVKLSDLSRALAFAARTQDGGTLTQEQWHFKFDLLMTKYEKMRQLEQV